MQEIPSVLKADLEAHRVDFARVISSVMTDRTPKGDFGHTFLGLTDEALVVANPVQSLNGHVQQHSSPDQILHAGSGSGFGYTIEMIPLKHIETMALRSLRDNGCMLTVRIDGAGRVLALGTQKLEPEMSEFVGHVRTRIASMLQQSPEKGSVAQAEGDEAGDIGVNADAGQVSSSPRCPECGNEYDGEMSVCYACIDRKGLTWRILKLTLAYKREILILNVCMTLGVLMNAAIPYVAGKVLFDDVLREGGRYEGYLWAVVLVIVGLHALDRAFGIFHGRFAAHLSARVFRDIKVRIFEALQAQSMRFFSKKHTGAMMSQLNDDAMELQYFFHEGFPKFLVNAVQLLAIAVMILILDWQTALIIFIPVPIIIYLMTAQFGGVRAIEERTFRANRALSQISSDALMGNRVIKTLGCEDREIARFEKANEDVYEAQKLQGWTFAKIFPLHGLVLGLGSVLLWGVAGSRILSGEFTFGTLVAMVGYATMLYRPIDDMVGAMGWWTHTMNAAQRIFDTLDAVPEIRSKEGAVPLQSVRGELQFENVSFAYEPGKMVIHNMSFTVEAGQTLGIVGHSGSGKSTIVNLLLRFYDPDQGVIRIDGRHLADIPVDDLRRHVGVVLQEPFLFNDTIRENIAYAKPDASLDEIVQAAMNARAHDFIMRLPDGYDTVLDPGGGNVSGGERQRISIARALLKNPSILLMDEATSAIDTKTEQEIQAQLDELAQGRTTVMLAHRLSTLAKADVILVVDQGKVVEFGTHAELVEMEGYYYQLLQQSTMQLNETA